MKRRALSALLLLSLCVGTVPAGADSGASRQLDFGVKMAQRGLWSEALFRFRQAERMDPGNARILNNIAVAYEAVGAFDKALETYQEAIRSGATNRELRNNYARFIEFYQSFKAPQESGGEGGEIEEAAGGEDEAGAEEPGPGDETQA